MSSPKLSPLVSEILNRAEGVRFETKRVSGKMVSKASARSQTPMAAS
jgi:hypothetical protein